MSDPAVSTDFNASRHPKLVASGAFFLLAAFVFVVAHWDVRQENRGSLVARPGDRLVARLTPAEGQTSIDYCLLQLDRLAVR